MSIRNYIIQKMEKGKFVDVQAFESFATLLTSGADVMTSVLMQRGKSKQVSIRVICRRYHNGKEKDVPIAQGNMFYFLTGTQLAKLLASVNGPRDTAKRPNSKRRHHAI